jgi:hypothetical protein
MADDDADADFRSYVARGLGRPVAGDSLSADAAARLRRLLDDPHAHVRVNAARSLATYGVAAREALLARVVDPDANVRVAVAQSLGDVLGPVAADWGNAWAADTGFTYRRSIWRPPFEPGRAWPRWTSPIATRGSAIGTGAIVRPLPRRRPLAASAKSTRSRRRC